MTALCPHNAGRQNFLLLTYEIKEQIAEMAKAGVKEVLLLPPVKCARENFRDFAEVVY